ncbi:hypothetical protein DPMN_153276 [Dreissena polymorpha]|uniref:Uncharacterized protein n=1 Tax=Dreissena polymorpha TaxID=45954 RepID=A0A9D4FNJ7_DREPO|nr:hypothetical protein DPMN_153276 [Dreissena polymorpha]
MPSHRSHLKLFLTKVLVLILPCQTSTSQKMALLNNYKTLKSIKPLVQIKYPAEYTGMQYRNIPNPDSNLEKVHFRLKNPI